MAVINFPSSPIDGQTFEAANKVYTYNSTKGYWYVTTYSNSSGVTTGKAIAMAMVFG